jgi:GT2 family glycosyltransferase
MSNSSNNYHFVVATPKSTEEFMESQICLFLDKSDNRKNSTIILNNKDGLPKVYNKFISEYYRGKKVVFVHDDVLIDDLFLEEKLDLAFEKYDIVGLAGAKSCDVSSEVSAWHLMSKKEDYVGEVAHSDGKKCWTTVFGPTDSRALTLDGLFIAIDVSKVLDAKNELFFDERFDFHHYDITFCLRANDAKLKMGVTPIKVTHFGLGDSMNTPEWHQSANKFKQIYGKK